MSQPTTTPTEQLVDRLKTLVALAVPIILVPTFIYFFLQDSRQKAEIKAYGHYTVGEVTSTGYVIGPNSESIIHFTYQVGDSTYEGTEPGDLVNGRTRFLVKFSTKNPGLYQGYKQIPISYYVPAPPPAGWAKLPPELSIPAGALD